MNRDLSGGVPNAIIASITNVIEDVERITGNASVAQSAYRAHIDDARRSPRTGAGEIARAIQTRALNLQRAVSSDELRVAFRASGMTPAPGIIVADLELPLDNIPTAPHGLLRTKLVLDLNHGTPNEEGWSLLRHHDTFDGYRVNGGGQLNSATAIQQALHPKMLRAVYDHFSSDGFWPFIAASIAALTKDLKEG